MEKRKQGLFDVRHPVFRPLWRRVALTAACLLWAVFELSNGETFWAIVFGACGFHLFLQFFVKFNPADYEPSENEDAS